MTTQSLRLAVLAGLVGALAACKQAAAPAGPTPVRVAYLQNDLHHLPLWVALDRGYFREEGLDVQLAGAFRSGAELVSAFRAGDLDLAYVGQAPATTAVARRTADLQVLALVNANGSQLLVRAADPARSLADLRGRTIAIPALGSMQDVLIRKALDAAGLGGAVQVVALRVPEMEQALQSGQVDAFMAWEPFTSQARTHGVARTLLASRDIWMDHPCCVLVGTRDFLGQRREAADAARRAHARAIAFIREHPADAAAIAARTTGMDLRVVTEALRDITYEDQLSRAQEAELVGALAALGYIEAVDPDAFVSRLLAPPPEGRAR